MVTVASMGNVDHIKEQHVRFCVFSILLSCALSSVASADVTLPAVFNDDMVLQRQMPVPVWGFADPGEEVTVDFSGQRETVKAGTDGKWMAKLSAMPAGGPFEMTVRGNNTINFTNVMVGEVWIFSGQSNMEFPLSRTPDSRPEIKSSANPDIRLFLIPKTISGKPKVDVETSWDVCSPNFADNFSAVAYFFGKRLNSELDVPIGLIQASYGGSKIEPWMMIEALEQVPPLSSAVEHVEGADQIHRGHVAEALKNLESYLPLAKKALDAGEEVPAPAEWPVHPLATDKQQPTCLYNGMINPIVPFAFRGVTWYQGEANCSQNEGLLYYEKFKAMLASWRSRWGQGDFPFYFVQLAPFVYGDKDELALFWENQTACLQIPNTGMAVTVDIGNPYDIHPTNKEDVAERLALWALAKDYGKKDIVYSGPLYKSMSVEGDAIRIFFDHVGGGLNSRDGEPLTWFSIAGADKQFVDATAEIDDGTVLVSSDGVTDPVAVRFGWRNIAEPNLSNKEGLPASPFRTDRW
jgi:sialate O-acetylesterase